jgi:hypothetical protein
MSADGDPCSELMCYGGATIQRQRSSAVCEYSGSKRYSLHLITPCVCVSRRRRRLISFARTATQELRPGVPAMLFSGIGFRYDGGPALKHSDHSGCGYPRWKEGCTRKDDGRQIIYTVMKPNSSHRCINETCSFHSRRSGARGCACRHVCCFTANGAHRRSEREE